MDILVYKHAKEARGLGYSLLAEYVSDPQQPTPALDGRGPFIGFA